MLHLATLPVALELLSMSLTVIKCGNGDTNHWLLLNHNHPRETKFAPSPSPLTVAGTIIVPSPSPPGYQITIRSPSPFRQQY